MHVIIRSEFVPANVTLSFLCHFKATLSSWESFEAERETVWRFISNTDNELHKELLFNCLDSLKIELKHNKVCICKTCIHSYSGLLACICSCCVTACFSVYRNSSRRSRSTLYEQISSQRKQKTFSLVRRLRLFSCSRRSPPEKQSHNFKTTSTRSMSEYFLLLQAIKV